MKGTQTFFSCFHVLRRTPFSGTERRLTPHAEFCALSRAASVRALACSSPHPQSGLPARVRATPLAARRARRARWRTARRCSCCRRCRTAPPAPRPRPSAAAAGSSSPAGQGSPPTAAAARPDHYTENISLWFIYSGKIFVHLKRMMRPYMFLCAGSESGSPPCTASTSCTRVHGG